MIIVIDLSEARVYLGDPDDFTRFSVAVEGERRPGPGRATSPGWAACGPTASTSWSTRWPCARWRGPPPTDAWDEGFSGMCAYAAGKGWVEDDGGVVAHIERRDEVG